MNQRRLFECSSPVCEDPCQRTSDQCPYERGRMSAEFRRDVLRGNRVGPLRRLDGIWAVDVEGWRPWGDEHLNEWHT